MPAGRNRGGNWKKLECQLGEIALGSGIEIKYCGQNFSELKKWLVTRRNSFEMGMEIGKIGLTTGRNLCSVNKLIFVMKKLLITRNWDRISSCYIKCQVFV